MHVAGEPGEDPRALAEQVDGVSKRVADAGSDAAAARRAIAEGARAAARLFAHEADEATAERWLAGFHLACVARDGRALRRLVSVPTERVRGWRRAWIAALQAWGRDEAPPEAVRGAAWDPPPEARDRAEALERPLVDLADALGRADADAFDEALARALDQHRAWYDAPDRRGDPAARIALGPLAWAVLARQRGLGSRVASDLLPAALLRPAAAAPSEAAELPALDARIREELTPLLTRLRGPEAAEVVRGLEPRPDDWTRVFDGEAADQAREAYRAFWARPEPPRVPPDHAALDVFVATTEQLVSGRAGDFPGGYRNLRGILQPARTWVAWRYRREGERIGILLDGLVWLDDHWSWFPKPWRAAQTDRPRDAAD